MNEYLMVTITIIILFEITLVLLGEMLNMGILTNYLHGHIIMGLAFRVGCLSFPGGSWKQNHKVKMCVYCLCLPPGGAG